ncbi:SusD/RagB family nutrient-binding outer membrane lipoprotein [Mucilaginibacter sp. KACC 22063]|uniref:SusD/RagB family nutrient-binding outer membrane lipoprotein n=1 Tax=Mucilaginibacter sp. KACC 22063 TaxID=3025666 RepID=UPI00236664BA|nr:SusD/RagB family nutrient-binding outer membrane lipoprotein [Mucilaginibacter sp. KACC 22063]WDF54677.1 SusD/RagB family nutrient-binding outer membrane lipoprotein [Mucilaginibacter sp. KACC 22063]
MKKGLIYSCLLAGTALVAGCTKNFDKVNTDPNKTTAATFVPDYLMSQAQLTFSQTGYDQLLFQSMWIQGLASTFDYYGNGDKYVLRGSGTGYYNRTWNRGYSALTLVDEMKNLIKGNAAHSNLDACGTILRVMFMQRVTDLYGDAPYSQEGQAKSGVTTPIFDKQQDIYTAMLTQLDGAITALDATKDKPAADLFYKGDISAWKRMANTLMLRVAMRLTKVDPATAQKYAEKAYANGTMSSIADNARVQTDNTNGNPSDNANAYLVPDDYREVRWAKTLMDYLQANSDPRISAIGEIAIGNGKAANQVLAAGDNTASLQIGLPNGYDLLGGSTDVSKAPGYPGATPAASATDAPAPLGKYSRPRFAVYGDKSGVNMILTYGESELLLAEAASRGWNTGVAAVHFANALAADMQSLSQLNGTPAASVSATDIAAYVAAHPLVPTTALQQINTEYWVETTTTWNFNEAYDNWRRSGYPVLTPVKYSGQYTDGSIPRRMPYPITLPQTNGANYSAAVSRQGADNFQTRVWWDK